MSKRIRVERIIIKVCMTLAAAAIFASVTLATVGHRGSGHTALACLFCTLAILSGTLFLRSTRGRS